MSAPVPTPAIEDHTDDIQEIQGTEELDVKQFNAKLKEIKEAIRATFTLAEKVFPLKKTENLNINGTEISRKMLRENISAVVKSVGDLSKYYRGGRKRRGAKGSRANNGFNNLIFINKNLAEFFLSNPEKLGPVDITKPHNTHSNPWLVTKLPTLTSSLVVSNTLTSLFSIYVKRNNLKDPKNGSMIHADEHMIRWLGAQGSNTFGRLAAQPAKTTKKGQLIPVFNANSFRHVDTPRIIADNRMTADSPIPDSQLSAEQKQFLETLNYWKRIINRAPERRTAEDSLLVDAILSGKNNAGIPADKFDAFANAAAIWQDLQNERDLATTVLHQYPKPEKAPRRAAKAKVADVAPLAAVRV